LKIEKILDQSYNFLTKEEQSSLLDLYKIYESYFMKSMGGQLFPHIKEVLCDLAKLHPVFIVSNCLSGYIENFIEFHHLQNIFSDFESSGNTGLSKAENIKLIIARNKLISLYMLVIQHGTRKHQKLISFLSSMLVTDLEKLIIPFTGSTILKN